MMRLILVFSLLSLLSCSEKSSWSEADLYQMAIKIEPKIEIILPKDISSGVRCSDYTAGCIRGKRAKLRRVLLTVVEFENEELAKKAAFHIGQYQAKNWVFDDVTGEPVLEDFVQKAFGAKKITSLDQ